MKTELREAKRRRAAKKKAAHARMIAKLTPGRYTTKCIRCGEARKGRILANKVKVCALCWRELTRVERRNINGFIAHLG